MTVQLRPNQEEVLGKIRNGSILQGDVGSGKSITSLAYYYTKIAGGELKLGDIGEFKTITKPVDLYIITTAAKRDKLEWNEELARYGLSVGDDNPLGIHIQIDSWNNIKKYSNIKKSFFLFDEQRVVGSGAWSRTFIKIAKANRWILLTATPGDTWMDYVPTFIANGFYKNRTEFVNKHVVYARYVSFPMVQRYTEEHILEAYRRRILVVMEYSRKARVNKKTIPVEYDVKKTKELIELRWNFVDDKPVDNISELCSLQRRIPYTDPSRIDKVKELIREMRKVIIFYNFNYELYILRDTLDSMEIIYGEWNGWKHETIPTGNDWVYLVQYNAGSEGWNCVTTNNMIFYSLNYSYKMMTQAAGRIDRMNTPFTDLNYIYLLSEAPIDQAVMKSIKSKKIFNEKAYIGS